MLARRGFRLEGMGIGQKLPDGCKNTYDAFVEVGYGKPATRRLPYNDFGVVLYQDVAAGAGPQNKKLSIVTRSRLSRAPTMSSIAVTCESTHGSGRPSTYLIAAVLPRETSIRTLLSTRNGI